MNDAHPIECGCRECCREENARRTVLTSGTGSGQRNDGRRGPGRHYVSRPASRRARAVWDYVTAKVGWEPLELWYNPPLWNRSGAAWWGYWMAKLSDDIRDVLPIPPREVGGGKMKKSQNGQHTMHKLSL